MSGFTNNFIVEDVARNYAIDRLIKNMINTSTRDQSNDDLFQYIMEYLLTYDNLRLNKMYNEQKLRPFISQIILKQRDGGVKGVNTHYVKYLRFRNNETFFNQHIEETTYDYTVDIIIDYIDLKSELDDSFLYSSEQVKSILAFTILKKYFLSDLTQSKLAKHLGLSRSTISNLLKFAKNDVYNYWQEKGQYIDYES